MQKLVITILSDSPFLPTGYRNQAVQLCNYLVNKGHEIHYLANAYVGNTLTRAETLDGEVYNFKIYGEMTHQYFQNKISDHLKKTKTDIFIILLDTFMLYPWLTNIDFSPAKSIFWFPTDGGAGMPKGCEVILKKVDLPVAMSEFGKKQVKDYYNIDSKHIPHGTKSDVFYRISDNERLLLKARYNLHDKFVVGVVARNQPRKMLDRTLKTFAYLKDKIQNAVLFLHLDPMDPAACFNMISMIQRYNLENRVYFSGMRADIGFTEKQLNEIYNLFDVFYLSTSGEGFGIPIIEAMSCEVPVIATDYTTTPELVKKNNAGFGAKLVGTEEITWKDFFSLNSKYYDDLIMNGTMTGSWEVERGIVDCKDAADKIILLANNPQLREEMGKNGRKAVIEKYDFNKCVGPEFEKVLEELK